MNERMTTKELLLKHCKAYPKAQVQDLFKFLYQSTFGCEHSAVSPMAAAEYIDREAAFLKPCQHEKIEDLDGEYCRVHLDCIKDGLGAETLAELFALSAQPTENGTQILEEKLKVLFAAVKEGLLDFSECEVSEKANEWKKKGYPACHHSEEFRKNYAPAYRVVKKEYALYLPLFTQIDCRLQKEESFTMAIEGGSASGKTTLAKLIEQIYTCHVFHMDDFFLTPSQRTRERLEEPGGNVDRERFEAEILIPLSRKEMISYRKFNCKTGTFSPPSAVMPKQFTVIEGAYSMHPQLAPYYDFSVFLDISAKLQQKRILKRNTKEMAERFFMQWIPLEEVYFEKLQIKEQCRMIIEITD